MPGMDYQELAGRQIFEVLARLFPDEVSTRHLLEDVGVTPSRLRPFGQLPQDLYWREAARIIDDGAFRGVAVADLIAGALARFPENARLRDLAGQVRTGSGDELRVLCLAAGPRDECALALAAEHREIVMAVRRSPRPVVPVPHPAVRLDDVVQRLHDARPHLLHFAGHGTADGRLLMEDDTGFAHPVDIDAFGRVLAEFGPLEAVILTSCYSAAYADALLGGAAKAVAGSPVPLPDPCAVAFSRHFYRELGEGSGVARSFDVAVAMLDAADCPPHQFQFRAAG